MKLPAFVAAALLACTAMNAQPLWKWVVPFTGPQTDEVNSLSISPNNTLYASGTFADSMTIGIAPQDMQLRGIFQYDGFMASITKAGLPRQAYVLGGLMADESRSVVVDKDGNSYVAGSFIDSIQVADWIGFGVGENPDEIGESSDMFIAKFDKSGICLWLKTFGSHDYDENSPFLAVDSVGNVYVGGGIGGKGKVQSKTHTAFGKTDAFIAKFNGAGEVVWLTAGGDTDYDNVTSLSVTPNGDRVYAVGFFHGSANFPQIPQITAFGSLSDFFVWAVNANGQSQWARKIGGPKPDNLIAGAVDKDGKLLITGALIGPTHFDQQTVSGNGEFASDVFLTRFTKTGAIDFVKTWGGVYGEVGTCVYGDKLGGIYVGGYYDSASIFDSQALIEYGERDGFVMRCEVDGTLEWIREMGGTHADEVRAIAVGTDNIPYAAGVFDGTANFSGLIVHGDRFSDGWVAALECGPNTRMRPPIDSISICEGQDSAIVAPGQYPSYDWFVDGARPPHTGKTYRLGSLPQGEHTVWVAIRDRYDCVKNSDTIHVTVRPGLDKPNISKSGNKLVTTAIAHKYQWFHEGVAIPGATTAETPLVGNGLYQVRISDSTGCTRSSDQYLEGTTDVGDELGFSGLNVYPNPTTGTLNISGLVGACEIVVINNLGMQVYRGSHDDERVVIDLSSAVAGTYTVSIRNSMYTTAYRIVRQ